MTLEERRKPALSQEEAVFPSKSVFVFENYREAQTLRATSPYTSRL